MKKRIALCLIILICIPLFSCSIFQRDNIGYRELGIPSEESYPGNLKARCVWDMAVYGDRLFIGGGDYNANAGPVDVWCWDIGENIWTKSGTLPDEEISRFCVINEGLTIPGTDPRDGWELGNYYVWEDGVWTVQRTIPGGLHNFDMVYFHEMMFAGLGVESGNLPVACSRDGGRTFSPVEMIKNGLPLDTSGSQVVRVYDLFVFGETLYAVFLSKETDVVYDLYRYESGRFIFDNTWYGKIHQLPYINSIMGGKAEFGGRLFFTTGYLYVTDDMKEFLRIAFPDSENVYDLYTADGCLYILCGKLLDDGQYRVSVWKNESGGNTDFEEIFAFLYEAPPLSLVRHESSFYIGMGDISAANPKNGMVICIDFPNDGD